VRNVAYGAAARNTLDMYLPDGHSPPSGGGRKPPPQAAKAPVVVFVTGGMWIIGYKAWGSLLSSRLRASGCLVASLDYRNFPQARLWQPCLSVLRSRSSRCRARCRTWLLTCPRASAGCCATQRRGAATRAGAAMEFDHLFDFLILSSAG
jgi:hypothetical protein